MKITNVLHYSRYYYHSKYSIRITSTVFVYWVNVSIVSSWKAMIFALRSWSILYWLVFVCVVHNFKWEHHYNFRFTNHRLLSLCDYKIIYSGVNRCYDTHIALLISPNFSCYFTYWMCSLSVLPFVFIFISFHLNKWIGFLL